MELFFNELSMEGRERIDRDSVLVLIKVYQSLRNYDITTCRIDSTDNLKLFQMIQAIPDSVNIKNFYFSFFRSPYESETVEKEQDEYLAHDWFYNGRKCTGLAFASVLNSAGLSIYGADWNVPFIDLIKDGTVDTVKNICTEEHVEIHIPQIQLEEKSELPKSDIPVEDKKISLRNDHGMDVLTDFSRRLVRCPYVTGIINSLPFNPSERKFIKKIRNDGLIEIVLPWTDKGYGIVVKTTGRNDHGNKKNR